MPRQNIRFQTFWCACQVLLFISATAAQYHFENWTTEQGLPYKTVRSVLQTRDGYIWAATSDGLARFDGVRFTVFNTANSPNLTTNRLELLAETVDGSLWISGDEEGLFRLRDGKFSSVSTVDGLPNNRIFSLYADKTANRLLILTQKGLAVWQDENLTSENLPELRQEYTALIDNTGAFCDSENNVVRRHTRQGVLEYELPGILPGAVILSQVFQDRSGAVWIGIFDRYLPKLFIFKNGEISVLTHREGLPKAFIEQILEDRQGNVWIAVGKFGKGGLLKFENGKIRVFGKEEGFDGISVLGLTEDREGGIWVATFDNGLTRLSEKIITSFTSEKSGLTSDNVYPIFEDAERNIFAGVWSFGDKANGGVDKFENSGFVRFAGRNEINSLAPTALFKDREGNLWIGAYGGLTLVKNGKFTHYHRQNGFPHDEVSAITQTADGTLWFGTAHGLTKLEDEKFTDFWVEDGLPHSDVRCLHESRDGTLWIGTSGGLGTYKNGKFTNRFDFPAVQVRSITEDADGTLWFGTYDAGIFRLRNGEFKPITIKDGLFDQGAFQILEDDFGRFWISCNRGIYRVNRQALNDFADGKIQTVTSVAYGVKDGMADAECNGGRSPAGFKSRKDGTLWFPTQKGIAVVNPIALPVNTQPPNVAIENCLLDGKEVACDDIKILPENDSFEIKYTGLSFNKPEQIKFKYKLEGLDENWIDAGTRRRAFFTHLPPGEYSFRVAAANVDGVWNDAGASLKITVKPPFYRMFWFLALCAILVISLISVIFNLRIKNLEKMRAAQEEFSRKLLESQENERQRIAAELHDSLGQDLLIIKNWALIGLKNGQDSSKQLGEISEMASQAIDEVREIAYNLRPFHLDELGLTKAIESMLERVSKSSAIDFVSEIDLIDGFFPKDAEINFYRIVQECVSNIVKHSGATEAAVSIKRRNTVLQLSVWDNGKGFDTDSLAAKRAGQSGFGLAGIAERARILGGKIVIESVTGKETVVNLILNKNKENLS